MTACETLSSLLAASVELVACTRDALTIISRQDEPQEVTSMSAERGIKRPLFAAPEYRQGLAA